MSMEVDKPENNIRMGREITKVGAIVFALTSIPPIIHTIYFLINHAIPALRRGYYYLDGIGRLIIGIQLGHLIMTWLMCTIPLTTASIVGKRLLYTKHKDLVYFGILVAFLIAICLIPICIWIGNGVSIRWV